MLGKGEKFTFETYWAHRIHFLLFIFVRYIEDPNESFVSTFLVSRAIYTAVEYFESRKIALFKRRRCDKPPISLNFKAQSINDTLNRRDEL